MLTAAAVDGVSVRALDEGSGGCIVVVHGGLGDAASWEAVATRLTDRFRVVRLHRRRYRLDLDLAGCAIADETRDLRAVAEAVRQPLVLVGHSSGAVVALEALAAGLPGAVGAVLYEPPALLRADEFAVAARCQEDLAAGHPRQAISRFLRDVVGLSPVSSRIAGAAVASQPRMRAFIPGQIGDATALNELGPRLDEYAGITVPVLLLTGERSPEHLGRRVYRLADVLPHDWVATLPGQGHGANDGAPGLVAEIIADFAGTVL